MKTQKKEARKRTPVRHQGGRPARPLPELIPDSPEGIARASMMGPPKQPWRSLRAGGQ